MRVFQTDYRFLVPSFFHLSFFPARNSLCLCMFRFALLRFASCFFYFLLRFIFFF